jgi:hypothetical protein
VPGACLLACRDPCARLLHGPAQYDALYFLVVMVVMVVMTE